MPNTQQILTATAVVLMIIAIYYIIKCGLKPMAEGLFNKKKMIMGKKTGSDCKVPYHPKGCGCWNYSSKYGAPPAVVYKLPGKAGEMINAPFSGPSFYSAHNNNTLEQRPGSFMELITYGDFQEPPAAIVKLIYQEGCEQHPLVPMFWHVKDQYESDETNPSSRIKFVAELADPSDPYNWESVSAYGPFPKIIKIRPNGQILEYPGHANFGAIVDWVRDSRILFNGPYY
jgi:hypothetical protein